MKVSTQSNVPSTPLIENQVTTPAQPRLRLLDAGNREFDRQIRRGLGHRQSQELKSLRKAINHYQANQTPSLACLEKVEKALDFWLASGKNRSRQQDPVVARLRSDIASRRQHLAQGGKESDFQLSWLCNDQGRVNQPIASNMQIKEWMSRLEGLRKEGAHDLFQHELQSALDQVFGLSEGMTALRLGRSPNREEVIESHEWHLFTATLRSRFPDLVELKPQPTAEEHARDTLLTHSQLIELQHLKEVLDVSLKDKVDKQGEIGLLRTELLTALVDGLDEPFLQRESDEQALWQKPGASLLYQTGIRRELKHPLETTSRERNNGDPLARKEFKELGLINASALVEAFAKIEIGKWEGKKEGAFGELAAKVTLSQENKATLKAEAVVGKAEGSLQFNPPPKPIQETHGERYKPGPHDFTLLRVGASAELVSKLGLSAEGSWTIGQLLRAKVAGKAEAGVTVKAEAGAALIATPQGPLASVTANASAFAGLKAEGSAELNLLKSQYADAYALSAKVKASANLGVGASAGATAAIGPQGAKFHTTAGVTLGIGTEASWEGGVNAMATRAYALELAARAARNFDQSRADSLDARAMQAGTENRLYELSERLNSRIQTLEGQLEALQLAPEQNRIRKQESLIEPELERGRQAMAQAIDDAIGPERRDAQGEIEPVQRARERNDKLDLTARLLKDHKIQA